MTDDLRQMIADLPGDDGWWHPSGPTTLEGVADELAEFGVPGDTIGSILERVYGAVANEYGD